MHSRSVLCMTGHYNFYYVCMYVCMYLCAQLSLLMFCVTLRLYIIVRLYWSIMYGRWKEILQRTVSELDREIAALSESKDALEQALEAKNLPTDVNVENLVTREGRRDIDVVEDEVEDQLQKVCVSRDPFLF